MISLCETLYSKALGYNELRVIRSMCYSLRTTLFDKFGKKSRSCILIDYPYHQKAYRLMMSKGWLRSQTRNLLHLEESLQTLIDAHYLLAQLLVAFGE